MADIQTCEGEETLVPLNFQCWNGVQ